MNCAVHPEVDATGYCRNCGKPMCPACARPVRDVLYCEDCLAQVVGIPAGSTANAVGTAPIMAGSAGIGPGAVPPVANANPNANPGVAFLLGLLVPGLGAIYNGEYNKAMLQILVFGGIIVGITGEFGEPFNGFWVLALVSFVFYMAIDALRVAKGRQTGTAVQDPLAAWTRNKATGPYLLIGIGVLFLLGNFGVFDYFQIRRIFWPVVLIGVGFLMLRNRISRD